MFRALTCLAALPLLAGCVTETTPVPPPSDAVPLVFNLNRADCGKPVSEGRVTLSADRRVLSFYESRCTATPAIREAMAGQRVRLDCQGEGETWQRDTVIDLDAEGLIVTDPDGTSRYASCRPRGM